MIDVRSLTHRFGDRTVLRGINLHVAPGTIATIMGSSGGGKTTLLKCISGLLIPSEGEVTVAGTSVGAEPERARRAMGMVFQSAALFDSMTVRENVLFGVRRHAPVPRPQEAELVTEVLELVGLDPTVADLLPAELSGGMRKRVGIARAIALAPKVLLYDEPTTGLDPITTYTIDAVMVRLAKERGVTSLVVSHDVSSVMRVSDQIAFLHAGELIFDGDPQGFAQQEAPAIAELIQKSRATAFSVQD
ncbi:MAG: ATP-binding cassette domain-containing protein [Fimbriimonadaceae bacterium]|nr:ATP-binding cassette domain-containing protein [Fimbriimonadaceae bacterium]